MVTNEAEAYRRLINIGIALSAEKDIDSLLERILVEAKLMMNADAGTLYIVNEEDKLDFAIVLNDTLQLKNGGKSGKPINLPSVPLRLPGGEPNLVNVAARAANTRQIIAIEDLYAEEDADANGARQFDQMTGYTSRSFLTVPLRSFSEKTIGVLQLINAKAADGTIVPFAPEIMPLVEALGSQASVALENRHLMDEQAQLRKQLEHEVDERTEELKNALSKLSEAHIILKELTTIDAVTGIRNRQYFDEVFHQEWRRAVRQKYALTLMLLDIDHFKQVNDTWGHLAGDEALEAVANAVNSLFNRPSDVVARYGGEEFVVILPYAAEDNAASKAEQVRSHIEGLDIDADGHRIKITVSIGWISQVPEEGVSRRSMLAAADKALYRAKSGGRNRVCTANGFVESE